MNGLRISPALELPIDVAGESTAILAKKGAGKSNTAKVIVEEVLDHGGVQVITLDPIGHWWSLRAGAGGKPKGGYPIAVFGGMHGDLPLEESAGKLLAQTAVESGQSMILDVSGLDSNGAMQRFVADFLEELYRLKQSKPTPTLVVLEEADEFAPQNAGGGNTPRMVGACVRISKRGRGRGLGMLYVTQRSASLNKNVLDQADTLIVMRTIGPRDRTAIEGWVKFQDAAGMEDVLPSLPNLETGEAWVWTPERGVLARVQIRKARTFDSSQTPKPGETAVVADVKPIDVEKLGQAIQATVERVKENDPAQLRKRARDAEAEVARLKLEVESLVEREVPEKVVEVSPIALGELEELLVPLAGIHEGLTAALQHRDGLLIKIRELGKKLPADAAAPKVGSRGGAAAAETEVSPRVPSPPPVAGSAAAVGHAPAEPRPLPDPNPAHSPYEVTRAQQKILDAIAALELIGLFAPMKTQVALFASASPKSSSFANNLGALKNDKGLKPWPPLVTYPMGGHVALTPEGRAVANAEAAPQTAEEMHRYVYSLVKPAQGRILEQLIAVYPEWIDKSRLAEFVDASPTSSSFANNLGALRSLQLIDKKPATVSALPILFLEGHDG